MKIDQLTEGYQDENREEKLWNADRHTRELAHIILSNVNGIAKKHQIGRETNTYDSLLTKQVNKVIGMISNDISDIQESDRAFSGKGDKDV